MRLRITHDTCYDYHPPVDGALHMAHLRMPDATCQQVLDHRLRIAPRPATLRQTSDVRGNWRHFIELATPHSRLAVRATHLVQTVAPAPRASALPWEAAREAFVYRAGHPGPAAAQYVFPSVHVHCGPAFVDYARPSFPPGRPLQEAARELMLRIHADFRYTPNSTGIHTPAADALQRREGVCQDFSHVMLACLRSLGLAARYVSGYLLTQPPPGQPRLIGSDASHAWLSVYLPDTPAHDAAEEEQHWYDLCPTNAREGWGTPGEDYVRLAVGRDFADVSPLRGVIQGSQSQALHVGVTVEPCEALLLTGLPELPEFAPPPPPPPP